MSKTFLIAALTGAAVAVATMPASAADLKAEPKPRVVHYKHAAPVKIPPHFVVERGPIHDGLGAVAAPRVFAPRVASRFPGVYGFGVGFSGGPVAKHYPYVKQAHSRQRALRVYY